MKTVPIHNYLPDLNLPNITASNYDLEFASNRPQIVNNFNNTTNPNKSLYYYKLKLDDEFKLYLNKVKENGNLEKLVQHKNLNLGKSNSFHFITPPEEIARDYLQYPNIKIIFTQNDYSYSYVHSYV